MKNTASILCLCVLPSLAHADITTPVIQNCTVMPIANSDPHL